ncbi:MAG: response regulator transcription factor [Candidatus Gracilibacteria bacterium]|nr:response regulator transcription factor [Candidatus Gracilibacteria bacterium]
MDKKRILIVEDDLALSTMYKMKFEMEGFDVMLSSDGLIAVSHVTDYEPDVILLDIMMPHMDGFETLKVIRQLAPSLETKIIMFSNLSSKEDIQKCMDYGADDYIIKANSTPKETVDKVKLMLGIS